MTFGAALKLIASKLGNFIRRHKIFLAVLLGILLLILIGQSLFRTRSSWDRIDKRKLLKVTIDLYQTEGFLETQYGSYAPDSILARAYAHIFRKHGVDRIDYDSSMLWYSLHQPKALQELWQAIQDSLSDRLALADSLSRHYDAMRLNILARREEVKDSVNLLSYPDTSTTIFLGQQLYYQKYERKYIYGSNASHFFEFNIRLLGEIPTKLNSDLQIGLAIIDSDTVKAYKTKPIYRAGMHRLRLAVPKQLSSSPNVRAYLLARAAADSLYTHPIPVLIDSVSLIRCQHARLDSAASTSAPNPSLQ
ncbi:hypothetical protein HQ45_00740 [Porphyromonas crevioricanis]|uniref:DUF4296 domain-containing protein n=1 Tax=Porphyromonas crevioricanis TaxID=393921 RepID=UPI00052BBD2E|nr:DUF4296 domain-containing protein [Porphyromonas crevioricanis]KGN91332.1 hypothetical protein HQ45_00740 [Porphyromonas crevioricanis]